MHRKNEDCHELSTAARGMAHPVSLSSFSPLNTDYKDHYSLIQLGHDSPQLSNSKTFWNPRKATQITPKTGGPDRLETMARERSFDAISRLEILALSFPKPFSNAIINGTRPPLMTKENCSLLFCDLVDYELLRGSLAPHLLVDLLRRLFAQLDRLAALHSVQPIDATDGCYLAATNYLCDQPHDHAARLAAFALASLAAAAALPVDPARPQLGRARLRAGLHCGAACGSVLGAHGGRKHTLVGAAVNVASRMQTLGAAGAAQCSAAFAAQLAAEAEAATAEGGGGAAAPRAALREGGVLAKGLGPMETYWLLPPPAGPGSESPGRPGGKPLSPPPPPPPSPPPPPPMKTTTMTATSSSINAPGKGGGKGGRWSESQGWQGRGGAAGAGR